MSNDIRDGQKVIKNIQNQMNKYADKIIVSQYFEKKEERNEGDVWTDSDGKQWTIKNGIKQSISALQDAKTPWWCPLCNRTMTQLDLNVFRKHAKCFDCLAKDETKLKMEGKWDEYIEKRHLENQIAYLKDRIIELTYYHDSLTNPEFMHFDDQTGNLLMIDKFTIPLDQVKKDLMINVVEMNKKLKELEREHSEKYNK